MNAISLVVFAVYALSVLSLLGLLLSLIVGARAAARHLILLLIVFLGYIGSLFIAQFGFTYDKIVAEVFIRVSLVFAGLILICIYKFLNEKITHFKSNILQGLGIMTAVIGFLSLLPSVVTFNFVVAKEGIGISHAGILYQLLIFGVLGGFLVTVLSLEIKKRRLEPQQEKAVNAIKYAFVMALGLNVVGAALSKYTWSQILTPVSMTFLGAMMYISIFKHQLFNIRLVIARSIAYLLSIFSISAVYALLAFLIIGKLLFPDSHLTGLQGVVFTLLAVFLSYSLQPLRKFYNRFSNAIFYRDAYDPQLLLDKLNTALVSNIEINNLLHKSSQTISSTLKSDFCIFGIYGEENKVRFFGGKSLDLTPEESSMIKKFFTSKKTKVILPNEVAEMDGLMGRHSIGLMTRLSTHSSNLGYLILGNKLSGSPYSVDDVKIMDIVTDELAIAIQNALRFEEIQTFNLTLQQKVDDATKLLRHANSRLKELDQTKDEFISMASHQLRTPLTTIKGYLSMVLEGDVGPVTKNEKQMIQQAFDSAERMVFLIGDLLNVSRLQSGKFVIDNKPTDMAKMVQTEVQQLKETAEHHGLKLICNIPDKLPLFSLDDTKIRQVVMNFMDNAIYYTPAGGSITVNLEATSDTISYTVVDTGLGVPKAEQHHLFTKFYRAGNARKMRPDGTGLGLFMAKKVIVAQGGAIIFKSEEGKGSTFGFSFPRQKIELKGNVAEKPAAVAAT